LVAHSKIVLDSMKGDTVDADFRLHKILIFVQRLHPVEVSTVPHFLSLVADDLAGVLSKTRSAF
jgi:hypothetical protein